LLTRRSYDDSRLLFCQERRRALDIKLSWESRDRGWFYFFVLPLREPELLLPDEEERLEELLEELRAEEELFEREPELTFFEEVPLEVLRYVLPLMDLLDERPEIKS
jgi:hypothetical protein